MADSSRKLKYIKPGRLSGNSLRALLSDSRENVIIMPSEQKISMGQMINTLPLFKRRSDITVYVTKKWLNSDFVTADLRDDFNIHFSTFFSHMYDSESLKEFSDSYNERFTDFVDEYAVLGHDIMLYFGRALLEHGVDFGYYINDISSEGIVDYQFSFNKVGPDSGYENTGTHLVYFDDFILKED